jgi:hypothetical protein
MARDFDAAFFRVGRFSEPTRLPSKSIEGSARRADLPKPDLPGTSVRRTAPPIPVAAAAIQPIPFFHVNREERPKPVLLDPGWLFLAAGVALLGATVIIPATRDLAEAQWLRDRALAVEAHREARLERYEQFLAALDERDPTLVGSLAASHLNQIPEGTEALPGQRVDALSSVSVFPALEPPPVKLPELRQVDSHLARWTSDDKSRLWLIAAGATCVLIGLLPASRGWGSYARRHPYLE